jgi:uncharacterized membrane protein
VFIRSVNGDALSLIHALSAWTMLTLPLAVLRPAVATSSGIAR